MNDTNEFGLTEEAMKLIYRIFIGFPEVDEVVIFGSRADGTYKPGSDIDLAIKGSDIDYIMTEHIRNILQEGLYLPYGYDVINYNSIHNPKFKMPIDTYGKVFYKRV